MKIIQGVKIITAGRHQDAANLRQESDEKTKPCDKESRNEEYDQDIRALLHPRKKRRREETRIQCLKRRRKVIIIQMKKRRNHMQPDSQGHKNPKERQPNRRPFL